MDIASKLENGEHIFFGELELYMNYNGTFWVRKEIVLDGEQAWEYNHFNDMESALRFVGHPLPEQLCML